MGFSQKIVFLVQVLFIALVFIIVFYRPKFTTGDVLGESTGVLPTLNSCLADISNDGVVDKNDYMLMRSVFLYPQKDPIAVDINNDHVIDLTDFGYIARYFGASCN